MGGVWGSSGSKTRNGLYPGAGIRECAGLPLAGGRTVCVEVLKPPFHICQSPHRYELMGNELVGVRADMAEVVPGLTYLPSHLDKQAKP